ncbi:hypothetical protein [Marivirga arenosa]|jgi:Flp pilus assembly protein TadB|uniref:Uncharacterized protein n=1 Tax=Marivirga arenosa TaxID=3059076 RepID=A0AA49GFE4_9BACT|nr:hypothetical protein [Marivirga sp. BKB1-2]WKK82410.1 hypothetical protein QYS47_10310 [Marivirga sp. BKB1-2]
MSPKQNKQETENKGPKPNFIIVGLAFALFVIGIHQSLTVGFEYSYWIFMLSISLLLLQRYLRQKKKTEG